MTRNVKTPISVKVFRSRDFYNTLENEDLHYVKHVPPLTFVCSLRLINKIKINEIFPFKRGKAGENENNDSMRGTVRMNKR